MPSHYSYGRRKELQVGEFLERRGFGCARAQGSRGPVDLIAEKGSLRLAIQVKATRADATTSARLRPAEETRLKRSAAGRRAESTLALVSRNYLWLVSVRDGTIITEGELKRLRRDYRQLS